MTPIEATNCITVYMHCALCLQDRMVDADHLSPAEYARLSVGWTPKGLQIWCQRHDCNIMHIDFEGAKHHANTRRLPMEVTP